VEGDPRVDRDQAALHKPSGPSPCSSISGSILACPSHGGSRRPFPCLSPSRLDAWVDDRRQPCPADLGWSCNAAEPPRPWLVSAVAMISVATPRCATRFGSGRGSRPACPNRLGRPLGSALPAISLPGQAYDYNDLLGRSGPWRSG
jgi:hypothetical protein